MKETNSRGKAHVVPVAVVAGVGMAGMGLVSNGVVVADTTSATDTINVTVQPSCTFNSVEDKTYAGSATNGTEVNNFNESGIHEFNLFCNDHNGFVVSATAYDLAATGVQDVIAYTNNYTHTGVNSMWTAEIASDTPGVTVVNQFVPMGGGTIISSDSHTTASGADFTASYSAYVGTETPAGTYTGTIVYTLTASGTSNNSNSGNSGDSGSNDNSGNGGTDSGNEVTDNTDNNGGSGGSGTGTGNSGTGGSGTGDANSGNSNPDANSGDPANSAPNNAPLAMSNTYNTYNTTNSYSTTNYSGGTASTPAVTGTQGATSGTTSGTTSGDNDSTTGSGNDNSGNSGANSNYEKPLGVVSTTSSNTSSDFDPMPIVVTGTALGVAGIAAIVVAEKKKKEEEEQ